MHREIAAKLLAKPELIEIARDNLDRWSLKHGRSQRYWDAWREILRRPLPEIASLLSEESEAMTALRQATPFAGVLEPAERWAVYARSNLVPELDDARGSGAHHPRSRYNRGRDRHRGRRKPSGPWRIPGGA
jgi:hypothetical protein